MPTLSPPLTPPRKAGVAAAKRPPVPSDTTRNIRFDAGFSISPDGTKLVLGHRQVSPTSDAFIFDLWLLDLQGQTAPITKPISSFPAGSKPAWSPDGSSFAFLQHGQLHLAPSDGSFQSFALTKIENGVNSFQWSPNGKRIVLTTKPVDGGVGHLPAGVRVFTATSLSTPQICVVDVPAEPSNVTPEAKQLVNLDPSIVQAAASSFWSKDGSYIYYTTTSNGKSTLWRIPADGTTTSSEVVLHLLEPFTGRPLRAAPVFHPSPDGARVAFVLGNPKAPPGFQQSKIFLLELATGEYTCLTADYDHEVGLGGSLIWEDDDTILTITAVRAATNLIRIHIPTQKITPIWQNDAHVVEYVTRASSTGTIFVSELAPTRPREVFSIDAAHGNRITAITALNKFLLDELEIADTPESITYTGPSGHTLQGWLYHPYPVASLDDKKFPLVIWPHAGPYAAWPAVWNPEFHAVAAAGYVLFLPNPRGSASFGQEIASGLAGGWPGPEYDDIMAGVDHLIATRPYVDGERLGLIGGSAAATVVDWAITGPDSHRFKAAAVYGDVADKRFHWFLGPQREFGKDEHGAPFRVWETKTGSPIDQPSAMKASTPTIFLTGTADVYAPAASGSKMMHRLLEYLGVPTALVEFEGAGHGIEASESTDIRHQPLAGLYTLKWFKKYLDGEEGPMDFGGIGA